MDSPFDSYFEDAIRDEDLQKIFRPSSPTETHRNLPNSGDDLVVGYTNYVTVPEKTSQTHQAELFSTVDDTKHELQGRSETKASGSAKKLRFTRTQNDTLEAWINANIAKPYPAHSQIIRLMKQTGLTDAQVRNWFVRKRQHLFRTASRMTGESIEAVAGNGSHDVDRRTVISSLQMSPSSSATSPSSDTSVSDGDTDTLLPCDGSSLSSEEEGSSAPSFEQYQGTFIQFYLQTIPNGLGDEKPNLSGVSGGIQDVEFLLNSIGAWYSPSEVGNSLGTTSHVSPGSISSARSSVASSSIASSRGRRQGRALFSGERSLSRHASISPKVSTAHQCDACGRTFTRRATLKRHQNTVHDASALWVCEGTIKYDGGGWPYLACPCCGGNSFDPDQCPHRMPECWGRDIEQRTFHRRDCLVQHWKGKSHT